MAGVEELRLRHARGDMPVMRMKGWRKRAADIFAKHGEIAAKMKSAPGPGPSDFFLMVLTATGDFAYRRDDGVVVCPLGCLKP